MKFSGLLLALVCAFGAAAFGQSAATSPSAPPPPLPVNHDFDFWIGEWDVYRTGTDMKIGESVVEAVADGHALYENWKATRGPQTGKSLTSCHHFTKEWQQFYVGSGGQTTHYRGGFVDGKLVITAETVTPQGAKYLNRGTWTNNPDGTVRQQFDTSTDGGVTWTPGFDGTYRRKPKA
jgi:hypothetical protein